MRSTRTVQPSVFQAPGVVHPIAAVSEEVPSKGVEKKENEASSLQGDQTEVSRVRLLFSSLPAG